MAELAQLQLGNILFLITGSSQSLQLNGQAMGVVAGHIGCLEAGHILIANNDILDDFVQRGAHVNVAVGIRRAVVQHETGLALVVLHQVKIKAVLFPVLQKLGLLFGQACTHFKIGFGQVDCAVVILCHWFVHSLNIFYNSYKPSITTF